MTVEIPAILTKRPFTIAEAASLGVSRDVLRNRRFLRLHRGVYVPSHLDLTLQVRLAAAGLALPTDAVVSHLSAARLWGFDPRGRGALQFSTNQASQALDGELRLHRRRGQLHPVSRDGLLVTGPDRTFVDCATQLSLVELVQFGDQLLHAGHTNLPTLRQYVSDRHLDGVQRARAASGALDARSESPMESLLRTTLALAGLPRFMSNVPILDTTGRIFARADLLDPARRVIAEYDGWQHERDAVQRKHDAHRREQLDALGYRFLVFSVDDLKDLRQVAWRVFHSLRDRGYRGAPPEFGSRWHTWFTIPTIWDPAGRSCKPNDPPGHKC